MSWSKSKNGPVKIVDGLWLGAMNDIQDIEDHVDWIISVCGELPDVRLDNYKGYICFNLDDNYQDYSLYDDFKEIIRITPHLIDNWRMNGGVFIHCQVGVSRSPAIIIHWLMSRMNMSYIKAKKWLAEKRYHDINTQFDWVLKELDTILYPEMDSRS